MHVRGDAVGSTTGARAADDVEALLAALGLDEKLRLLSGDLPLPDVVRMSRRYNARPYTAAAVPRLGLEGIRFCDGPRGVVIGRSTAFPVAMARGGSYRAKRSIAGWRAAANGQLSAEATKRFSTGGV